MMSTRAVEMATNFWRECARDWYPNLHSQTYFLPPLHFNRVPYDVQSVAGQTVLVPTPGHVPVNPVPSGPPPQPNAPPLASRIWPDHPVPSGLLPQVSPSDERDDHAVQQVLDNIRELAKRRHEVMMVISQLEFRKYLDNQVDPITAAATRLLPGIKSLPPASQRGDFDVLIISRQYGLIVGEVKSVGAIPQYSSDETVVNRIEKAVEQLNKAKDVLSRLVSDLAPVNVTKILMLPNVTCTQLQQALSTNPRVEQHLRKYVGAPDTAAAVARCLCADSIQSKSSVWWERAVTDHGHDGNMTDDIYETLIARFCGPATTVEVPTVTEPRRAPTVTTPRRAVEVRTLTAAIAHTGLRMAVLTLYPEQVDLLNRSGLPLVLLWGPPGTGKTVVLVLRALQWRHQGKDVHLLSLYAHSRAVILLIEYQLLHALSTTATPAAAPRVHRHMYDVENNEGDVETAVNTLAAAASNGELYVITDEVGYGKFDQFCSLLANRVPDLHLWAAAVERVSKVTRLTEHRLTTPVRSPPAVMREVQRSVAINDVIVPRYSSSATPAPTDGPEVRKLRHYNPGDRYQRPLSGHTLDWPEKCERCGDNIADLLKELRVGQSDLQYRDTIIVCDHPRDNMPVVSSLRARGLPVHVVTSSQGEAVIRDVALGERDAVTVTHYHVVKGLERRVVVVMVTVVGVERLHAMSRSTSLLVLVH